MSPHLILTANLCVEEPLRAYSVQSSSGIVHFGRTHIITEKISHYSDFHTNDLALLVISPPVNISHSLTQKIELMVGPVFPNVRGIISGWGCNKKRP